MTGASHIAHTPRALRAVAGFRLSYLLDCAAQKVAYVNKRVQVFVSTHARVFVYIYKMLHVSSSLQYEVQHLILAFDFRRQSIDLMNSSKGSPTAAHVCTEGDKGSYVVTVLTFFLANIGCASVINKTLTKPYHVQ